MNDVDFFLEEDTFSSTCSGYSEFKADFVELEDLKWNTYNLPPRSVNNDDDDDAESVDDDFNSNRNISSSTALHSKNKSFTKPNTTEEASIKMKVQGTNDIEIPTSASAGVSFSNPAGEKSSPSSTSHVSVLIHEISPKNTGITLPNVETWPRVVKI